MNKITEDDVEFFITITPEEEGPEGWMEDDMAADVRKDYESGNDWAWCQVVVHARLDEWHGAAFLGGCSYKSEDDFMASDYYGDLCEEAFEDLLHNISETKTRVVLVSSLFK